MTEKHLTINQAIDYLTAPESPRHCLVTVSRCVHTYSNKAVLHILNTELELLSRKEYLIDFRLKCGVKFKLFSSDEFLETYI